MSTCLKWTQFPKIILWLLSKFSKFSKFTIPFHKKKLNCQYCNICEQYTYSAASWFVLLRLGLTVSLNLWYVAGLKKKYERRGGELSVTRYFFYATVTFPWSMYGKKTKTTLDTVRSRYTWWKKRIEVSHEVKIVEFSFLRINSTVSRVMIQGPTWQVTSPRLLLRRNVPITKVS